MVTSSKCLINKFLEVIALRKKLILYLFHLDLTDGITNVTTEQGPSGKRWSYY